MNKEILKVTCDDARNVASLLSSSANIIRKHTSDDNRRIRMAKISATAGLISICSIAIQLVVDIFSTMSTKEEKEGE